MIIDTPVVRALIKGIAPVAAGLSGIFAKSSLGLSLLFLAVAVADVVLDYLVSSRLTSLVLERISGILEAAYNVCAFPDGSDVRVTVFAAMRNRMKARQSYLAIPVFDADRKPVGAAHFDSMRPDAFGAESVDVLTRACVPLSKWVR